MRKVLSLALLLTCFGAVVALAQANVIVNHPDQNLNGKIIGRATQVVGTLIYDTGAPDFISVVPGTNRLVGNRFDSDAGNPIPGGSAYQFTFWASGGHFPSGQLLFLHNPPVGATASPIGSVFGFAAIAPSAFNAISFTPIAVPSAFLGDLFVDGGWGGVGMDNDTTQGQGFHAFYGYLNPAPYTLVAYSAQPANTLLRMTGDLIPVELIEFEVD